jgi:leucyl/phenylalanyl-tRNA--protein transferase
LVKQLEKWNYSMIDCQIKTAHLASFGAREIPRKEFSNRLKESVNYPNQIEKWNFDNESIE